MSRRTAPKPASDAADEPQVEPQVEAVSVDALAQILDTIEDASGYEVMVYELDQAGRHMLQRAGLADFDIWGFAERFGGGDYELRTRDVRSKQLGPQRRFSVSKRVPRKDAGTPAQPTAAADTSNVFGMMMQMMQLQMNQAQAAQQQQTAILTAVIGRPQTDNLSQLIQAAQLLTGKNDKATPIGELIEGVKQIQALGGGGVAAASDEIELAKIFAPALTALLTRPAQQPAPQQANAGSVGAGALLPALPAPSTRSAQPAAADTHSPTTLPPAAALPMIPDDERRPTMSATIDTLSAIALRIGLAAGGAIDGSTTAKIAHQMWQSLDLEMLGEVLDYADQGELAEFIILATPEMLREQMSQHRAALRQVEGWLRESYEAAKLEDDQDEDQETPHADSEQGKAGGGVPGAEDARRIGVHSVG